MRVNVYDTRLTAERGCNLVKEQGINYQTENKFTHPAQIDRLMRDVFELDRRAEEYVYLLCFTTSMHLLGVFEISHGTVNMSSVSPREILQKSLLCNAANIMLVHNHPSGNTIPSKMDCEFYKRMQMCAELMGIPLVDNLIIGEDYYSFNDKKPI